MSYDLRFIAREEAMPTADAIEAHFRARNFFAVTTMPEGRIAADYHNTDTGVICSFAFDPSATSTLQELPEGHAVTGLTFEVGYFRPTYFALEAFPLVATFAEAFGLLLEDAQRGTVAAPDVDALVEKWKSANAWAIRSMPAKGGMRYLPEEYTNHWWRMMMAKRSTADLLGDEPIFYPDVIILLRPDNTAIKTIVWPDGIPQFFPECNYVYVGREGDDGPEAGLVSYDDCLDRIEHYMRVVETPYGSVPMIVPEMADRVQPIVARFRLEPIDLSACTHLIPADYSNVPPAER